MSGAPIMVLAESQIIQEFHLDTAMLDDAKQRYSGVDASTKDGYALAIEGRALFRDTRIAIDKRRKELKADALAYGKRVDSVAKQLTELVSPTEDELDAKIKKIDQAKADAKAAELRAKEEAERARLKAEQEAEQRRLAAEREAIEAERKALEELRAQQEAEAQARREQEERERQAREEAERKRMQDLATRLEFLRRLHNTGMPGCAYDDTCTVTEQLTRAPIPEFAQMPLDRLESLVATKELAAKEQREARARLEQQQREQREADERKQAEARAAEEQRLAQQRADIEAREAVIAAKEKAEREAAEELARKQKQERFGLLACIVGINRDCYADERDDPYHCTKIWAKFRDGDTRHLIESDDELLEPFSSMPIEELRALVADQTAKRKSRNDERARIEAEERAVAEAERQAALAKRREALRPDCEKLRVYAESIRTVPIPEFSDDAEVTLTINTVIDSLLSIAASLDEMADAIEGKQVKRTEGSNEHVTVA